MTSVKRPACYSCAHFRKYNSETDEVECDAFPTAVPADILFEGFDHRNPHDGDNGIRYERDPKAIDPYSSLS